nr:unnamed protein product [Spirometra erinaceieuropaei]
MPRKPPRFPRLGQSSRRKVVLPFEGITLDIGIHLIKGLRQIDETDVDAGSNVLQSPGKKKLSDSGYTDSSYNKTNVGKRAECGSMFALLSHKYQYEWIEQMQGKLEAQHAEKYQKEQLRKCKPTDTHASYLRSMKQMDKSATLREMARKDYEAVARINSQYYCPCRQPVCPQPDSGACP